MLKSDLTDNMDHMRISGTEPSSLIRRQTKYFQKLESDVTKVPKQGWAKRDGVINTHNQSILARKILMLSKRYESTEVDRRTWYHVPSGTRLSTSSDTHQAVEIEKRDFY